MRQIVRQWPDAGEDWNEVWPRVCDCELEGLRSQRWLAPQESGIQVEQRRDEFPAIAQRSPLDETHLKPHAGFTKQPPLALQPADESRQVAVVDRAHDLLHEKRLPRSGRCGVREVQRSLGDEIVEEGEAAHASVDVFAEFGIECDGALQQDGRDGLVLKAAGAQERFIYG